MNGKYIILIGLLIGLLIPSVSAYTVDDYQNIIFWHHSTGNNVYTQGNVASWMTDYNTNHGTSFNIYAPWSPGRSDNYPFDYWDLWVNNNCAGNECLPAIVANYDVIIWKQCFPGSAVLADTGSPNIASQTQSLENYKLQYRALRDVMDSYPDKIFIIWTLPPLHRLATNAADAQRATDFGTWVKTDFLTENGEHPNIYIYDFRSIVMGLDNYLNYSYEGSHTSSDSHPNNAANIVAGPIFGQTIVDSINDFVGNAPVSTVTYNAYDGSTTDFVNVADESAVSNAVVEKISFGKIEFGAQSLDFTNANLDSGIFIQDQLIGIDSAVLPNLNVPATITFYNVNEANPIILEDGVTCTDCSIISHVGTDLVVSVQHFSNYTVGTNAANSSPVFISACSDWNCVLTYPRYKLIQSNINPDELWVGFENNRYDNFKKSIDGGLTWDATTPTAALTIKEYMNYHASIVRDSNNNIHIADIGSGKIYYRKINYPGESSTDMGPLLVLNSSAMLGPALENLSSYAHVIVQDINNIFIAYRVNDNLNINPGGNVRYFKSSDGGVTFPEEGIVYATGLSEVRIGTFDLNGMPAVAIHNLNGGSGIDITYHVWDGTSFIENPDYIVSSNEALGWERTYSMIYVNGQLHATWSNGNRLRHAWKDYNNGIGTWNVQDVVTLGYTPDYYFQPTFSKRGNELYLIYSQIESPTDGSISNVYYTKWNSTTNSWENITAITTDGGVGGLGYYVPHGPAEINPTSTFLPIVYSKANFLGATGEVYYNSISLTPQAPQSDTTPPIISDGAPTGILSNGTVLVEMNVTTNESATCKYDNNSLAYSSMTNIFTTTGGLLHSSNIAVLDGNNYTYYIRCNDTLGNINLNDYVINFNVSEVTSCTLPYDTPPTCDDCIDIGELASTISGWYSDQIGIPELMTNIKSWKGCN